MSVKIGNVTHWLSELGTVGNETLAQMYQGTKLVPKRGKRYYLCLYRRGAESCAARSSTYTNKRLFSGSRIGSTSKKIW